MKKGRIFLETGDLSVPRINVKFNNYGFGRHVTGGTICANFQHGDIPVNTFK